jgi:fructose-1,6-bisphosphatase
MFELKLCDLLNLNQSQFKLGRVVTENRRRELKGRERLQREILNHEPCTIRVMELMRRLSDPLMPTVERDAKQGQRTYLTFHEDHSLQAATIY